MNLACLFLNQLSNVTNPIHSIKNFFRIIHLIIFVINLSTHFVINLTFCSSDYFEAKNTVTFLLFIIKSLLRLVICYNQNTYLFNKIHIKLK